MAYPKPLTAKTIERRCKELGLTDKKVAFLQKFYQAAANLYGVVPVGHLWSIYKELAEKNTDVKKKRILKREVLGFSEIVRRELHTYRVYEESDIYADGVDSLENREVVNQVIPVDPMYMNLYDAVVDAQPRYPYFVPDNMLDYAVEFMSAEEEKVMDFIGNLRATATTLEGNLTHKSYPSPHKGKKLRQIKTLSEMEKQAYDMIREELEESSHHKETLAIEALQKRFKQTVDKRIMDNVKTRLQIGLDYPNQALQGLVEGLELVGVQITVKQAETLAQLFMAFTNSLHMFCMRGWAPTELRLAQEAAGIDTRPRAISFGPGIQKAIENGDMDADELKKMAEQMGLKILNE